MVLGPQPGPVTLDIDTKLAYAVAPDLQLGVESYNGLGALSHPGNLSREDQTLYLVADTHVGHWDLNTGVGSGYGGAQDRWVVKAVIGVSIE